jgi:hypothetical protein
MMAIALAGVGVRITSVCLSLTKSKEDCFLHLSRRLVSFSPPCQTWPPAPVRTWDSGVALAGVRQVSIRAVSIED